MAKRRRKRRVTRKRTTVSGPQIAAHPVTYDGFDFDSKLEARWYESLRMSQPPWSDIDDNGAPVNHLSRECLTITLSDGSTYTPDLSFEAWFNLDGDWECAGQVVLEIKPTFPNKEYLKKLTEAAKKLNTAKFRATQLWLGVGNIWHKDPDPDTYMLNRKRQWVLINPPYWPVNFQPGQKLRFDI